jgi:hypothetical protein
MKNILVFLKPNKKKVVVAFILVLMVLLWKLFLFLFSIGLPGCFSCPDGTVRYGACDAAKENWCAHWIVVYSRVVVDYVLLIGIPYLISCFLDVMVVFLKHGGGKSKL